MTKEFAITYDYLCPFARNANETIAEAIDDGADWAVTFRPFSLSQNRVGPDDPDVWDENRDSDVASGVRALLWSLAIRDVYPEHFLSFHTAMFAARHADGANIGDENVITRVAEAAGLDVRAVNAVLASGVPRKTLKSEHLGLVEDHSVFGVPTFIAGDDAVFVRIMERHNVTDIDRVLDMLSWTNVNEFKRTRVPQ